MYKFDNKEYSVLAVVPARGGSKSVKLKNIREINSIPIVGMAGNVVKKLPWIDRAIVSTDHPKIAEVAKEYGLDAPFYRSEELSGDRISDWQVLNEAIRKIEEIDQKQYDLVLMLQPTSPMRKPSQVEATLLKLLEGGHDAVWTFSETDSKGHPLTQYVKDENDKLLYYDERGKQIVARQQLTPQTYHRNGVAYAFRRECILEQGTIYGKDTAMLVIDDFIVDVDSELDLKWIEFLFNEGIASLD